MTVYVLFHADLEDDRYVRGVFATRTLAESQVSVDEVSGRDRPIFRSHGDYCCGVDELEVAETAPDVYHGPPPPLMGESIIPEWWYERWAGDMAEPNPYRALLGRPS